MKSASLVMYAMLCFIAADVHAFQSDDEEAARKQAALDQACEDAREVKLAPMREQAFRECMSASRSTDSAQDCRRKTAGINADRVGGNPRFYDLPACVAAFEHRKEHRRRP